MIGLGHAVSTNPADAAANDALLHSLKAELPDFIADIVVATPDGQNIGSASGQRYRLGNRTFFKQVLAGEPVAFGDPLRSRADGRWVFPAAHAIRNSTGELQALLIVGTLIESFRDALRLDHLPAGSIVRIVNERGIAVAAIPDVPDWAGHDLLKFDNAGRRLRNGEGSELSTWYDHVTRVTGYTTAYRAPWLVTVGMRWRGPPCRSPPS